MSLTLRKISVVASIVLAASAGAARSAERSGDPTTAELLRRIEALEHEVRELRDKPCDRGEAGAATIEPASHQQPAQRSPEQTPLVQPASESPASAASHGAVTVHRKDTAEPAHTEEATAKAKPVAGYDDGFFIQSADGTHKLKIEGYVQADSRFFVDSSVRRNVDQFVIRRARLDLKAKFWNRYVLRLAPDFAGSELALRYAYGEIIFSDAFTVRAGKQKTPFGIEQLYSAPDLPFTERALPDNLVPSRDIGVQLYGNPGGRVLYQLAVLNGAPDGGNVDGDTNDAVDVVARVFATPFAPARYSPFRGAGFGVAGTYGREQGSTSSSQLPSFRTTGRTVFFAYEDDVFADGDRWRVSPQASWYEGPFGFLTEYVRSSAEVSLGSERAWVDNQAWQLRTSWILTGEHASAERVEPEAPFDFGDGHWGAWQLALRWSSLDVDEDAFDEKFADPTTSARHADAIGAAINWYLNHNVAVYLDYEHTMFGGGDGGGDRPDEDVFVSRMQFEF